MGTYVNAVALTDKAAFRGDRVGSCTVADSSKRARAEQYKKTPECKSPLNWFSSPREEEKPVAPLFPPFPSLLKKNGLEQGTDLPLVPLQRLFRLRLLAALVQPLRQLVVQVCMRGGARFFVRPKKGMTGDSSKNHGRDDDGPKNNHNTFPFRYKACPFSLPWPKHNR